MIKLMDRHDAYAYRLDFPLSATVTSLDEGTWVTLNSSGELIVSGGTAAVSFMAISSKRSGRDNITPHGGHCTVLAGHFGCWTDKYNALGSYAATTTPLKIGTGGLLDVWASASDGAEKLIGYAIGQPTADGLLRVFIK